MSNSLAPPWRVLALLAALVAAAHAMLLGTHPKRFEPESNSASPQAQAFVTRRIERPPAPVAAPPVKAPAKPVTKAAKPASKPPIKEKEAAAQEERPPAATDLIATTPQPEVSNPETPAAPASEPAQATAPAAAASAPLLPAGPGQTPVTAMALPESVRLAYKMTGSAKGMTYHANAELGWHNTGTGYDASMKVGAFLIGSRSMASTGQVSAEGLAPTRYSEKSRSEVAAHFEPDKGQISFSANTPSAPWVKGAQDRVSVFMQLAGMLAGSPGGFPVGSSISLYTVGPRDADIWTFLVEAEEKISLPFGEMATLKLTRQPRREYDTKVEVWYAPALGYLPVRNKITQSNGDFGDQQLTDVSKP
ncbi:MAG TPA: DUF3108 domain-containing protein [Polaromonas sp.]|jgi:hypothetical protein